MTFKLDQSSIYDLSLLSSHLFGCGCNDERGKENFSRLLGTIYLFGVARLTDASCNLDAVKNLYMLFDRDICIIEHFIDQLYKRFYGQEYVDFFEKLSAIAACYSQVQQLLRRINLNDISTYAPWRFVLYRLMVQTISHVESLNMYSKTDISRLPLYATMIQACGGVDFSRELDMFCHLVNYPNDLRNGFAQPNATANDTQSALQSILNLKIQSLTIVPLSRRQSSKKSQLCKSWSSSEEEEDDDAPFEFGDMQGHELVQENILPALDGCQDAIQILLSIEPFPIDERIFDGIVFDQKEIKVAEQTIVVASIDSSQDCKVVEQNLSDVKTAVGQIARWRSPSLEAAKERYQKEQSEKKPKRFPYRRQKKMQRVVAEVATLVTSDEKTEVAIEKKPELLKTATATVRNSRKTVQKVVQTPQQATGVANQQGSPPVEQKKKKKSNPYNKVWVRNN